ncbi:MAG TPA: TonB family protein, partial [Terriglobales bacterium]|nr:TonB family protein [Terriglobales bacterium]
DPAPPALFIDLKEIIAGGAEEGTPGAGRHDGVSTGSGAAPRAVPAPTVRPEREPRAPSPRRMPESSRTRERAPVPEDAVTSAPSGLAVTPAPATPAAPPSLSAPAPGPAQSPPPSAAQPVPPSGAPPAAPPVAGSPSGAGAASGASSAPAASGADDRTGVGSAAGGRGAGGERGIGGGAGERLALVVPGAGGSGADEAGEYGAYLARLRERLQQSLRYPTTARRRGLTGTVQLEIAIETDGAIAGVAVIGSSSHDVLDRAAADAARALARQPFPGDVRARPLRVRLPVVFEMQ